MTRFHVNATLSVSAWVAVEAETESEAFEQAEEMDASQWEFDIGTGEIAFNVIPQVEIA